jgi:hypothetical protein
VAYKSRSDFSNLALVNGAFFDQDVVETEYWFFVNVVRNYALALKRR